MIVLALFWTTLAACTDGKVKDKAKAKRQNKQTTVTSLKPRTGSNAKTHWKLKVKEIVGYVASVEFKPTPKAPDRVWLFGGFRPVGFDADKDAITRVVILGHLVLACHPEKEAPCRQTWGKGDNSEHQCWSLLFDRRPTLYHMDVDLETKTRDPHPVKVTALADRKLCREMETSFMLSLSSKDKDGPKIKILPPNPNNAPAWMHKEKEERAR